MDRPRAPGRSGRAGSSRSTSSIGPPRCRRARLSRDSTIAASWRRAAARRRRSASTRRSSIRPGCLRPATTAARSPPLPIARAADAKCRPGQRLEALFGDLLATVRADPKCAFLDAPQRGLDLLENVFGVLLEGVVELAIVRLGRGVGEVVSHFLAGLFGEIAGILRLEVLNRSDDARLLFELSLAKPIGLECGQLWSFPAAERRRSI